MACPSITHLQFAVLEFLADQRLHYGSDIREGLKCFEVYLVGPAFYQLMGRLEESKHVVGVARGKERVYEIAPRGLQAYHEVLNFYRKHIR